jgi:DNA-binding transcriptional regulator YdaS (Cro superfamily)
MNCTDVINCLLDELRRRVRSGEVTERGLAQMVGLSQPHLHHVLKGKRQLSPAKADAVLRHLDLDLLDLISPSELRESHFRR